jgi:glycosyltransferase involved in cell wall biosynthesis
MPTVTIGIPVYNGANFLGAAIESILAQSYSDFELLISDNASTDATQDICCSYARCDPRIRYIRQPKNVGAARNHNILVESSESRYFKWAAHDDVIAPDFLATCVEALERNPNCVLASPASTYIDEKGAVLPYSAERNGMVDATGVCWPVLPEDNPDLAADDPAVRFRAVMLQMVMCVEIFGLIRRSALRRTSLQGAFDSADKVVLAQLSLMGPFWLGQRTQFFRRCHPAQFSASTSGRYRAEWFSGRRESMFFQQLKLLAAYCGAAYCSPLTLRQRAVCLQAILWRALSRGHQWQRLTGALVGN